VSFSVFENNEENNGDNLSKEYFPYIDESYSSRRSYRKQKPQGKSSVKQLSYSQLKMKVKLDEIRLFFAYLRFSSVLFQAVRFIL